MSHDDNSKAERIDLRIDPHSKDLFSKAARLSGLSLSAFVVEATRSRAADIIDQHNRVLLNNQARDLFMSALAVPPAANATLKQAAKKRQ